jgi:hypothetical protein
MRAFVVGSVSKFLSILTGNPREDNEGQVRQRKNKVPRDNDTNSIEINSIKNTGKSPARTASTSKYSSILSVTPF